MNGLVDAARPCAGGASVAAREYHRPSSPDWYTFAAPRTARPHVGPTSTTLRTLRREIPPMGRISRVGLALLVTLPLFPSSRALGENSEGVSMRLLKAGQVT